MPGSTSCAGSKALSGRSGPLAEHPEHVRADARLGRHQLLELAGEVVDARGELGLAGLDHRRVKGAAHREKEAEALLGDEVEAGLPGEILDLLILEAKRAQIVGAVRLDRL